MDEWCTVEHAQYVITNYANVINPIQTGLFGPSAYYIQPFRGRLSEKVHATIPKGIVGGFEFTVFQRNLKEWHERP